MKTLGIFLALLCLLTLSRCSKSNDDSTANPPADNPKKIIQLKIDTSFLTDQSDNWIIAHDLDGKLLAFDSFESGDLVKLESTNDIPDNLVNITFFQYFVDGRKQHYLDAYLSNAVGQEWTVKKEPFIPQNHGNKTGNFTVSVSDVPEGSAFQLSNRNGMTSAFTWGGGMLNFNGELYDNAPSWLLYVTDHTGIPKYKFYN